MMSIVHTSVTIVQKILQEEKTFIGCSIAEDRRRRTRRAKRTGNVCQILFAM
jgi:hypothetical protein